MLSGAETQLPLSPTAALVLVLAGGAMPFAGSAENEAERWLRVLRLHGDAGRALQALGVGERPLVELGPRRGEPGRRPLRARAVPVVVGRARRCAASRGIDRVGTPELLVAVLQAYGALFTEALQVRGTSPAELLERVASRRSAAA